MTLEIKPDTVPMRLDADGVARIGGTRVTLETVVAAFKDGATAEEIAAQYPALPLADIYAVIAYYLKRIQEVEAYLSKRHDQAEGVRKENEARFDPEGIRDRLMSRHPKDR